MNSPLYDSGEMPTSAAPPAARPTVARAVGLDALRGLAILGMVLSGTVPWGDLALPGWMYHAQTPPPTGAYDLTITGITWVDVVFPLFLFALGAAVPLAMMNRLAQGKLTTGQVVRGALLRWFLLIFFALYKQHLTDGGLGKVYGDWKYGIQVLGFLLLFPVFMRFPRKWPAWLALVLRGIGWIGMVGLLAWLRYPDGEGFALRRHDIILVILANVALSTTLVWWALRKGVGARLCLMGLLIALHLARRNTGWAQPLTDLRFLRDLLPETWYDRVFWMFNPGYHKYLLLTIPGTIAGSIFAEWMNPTERRLNTSIMRSRWRELSLVRCVCLALVCVGIAVGVIAAFSMKDWRMACTVALPLCALGLVLLLSPPSRGGVGSGVGLRGQPAVEAYLFRSLFCWGVLWLLLGLALHPYQGGIRKDPATLSYLFTTAGLANMLLVLFGVITDALHRPGLLFLLVDNGKNPMIAYVAGSMFIIPILLAIPVGDQPLLVWLSVHTNQTPWTAFARGAAITLLVALFVSLLTRMKVFWRT